MIDLRKPPRGMYDIVTHLFNSNAQNDMVNPTTQKVQTSTSTRQPSPNAGSNARSIGDPLVYNKISPSKLPRGTALQSRQGDMPLLSSRADNSCAPPTVEDSFNEDSDDTKCDLSVRPRAKGAANSGPFLGTERPEPGPESTQHTKTPTGQSQGTGVPDENTAQTEKKIRAPGSAREDDSGSAYGNYDSDSDDDTVYAVFQKNDEPFFTMLRSSLPALRDVPSIAVNLFNIAAAGVIGKREALAWLEEFSSADTPSEEQAQLKSDGNARGILCGVLEMLIIAQAICYLWPTPGSWVKRSAWGDVDGSPHKRRKLLLHHLTQEPAVAERFSYLSTQELEQGLEFILQPLNGYPLTELARVAEGIAALMGKNPSFERIRAAVYGWSDHRAVSSEQKRKMLAGLLEPDLPAAVLDEIVKRRPGPLCDLVQAAAQINQATAKARSLQDVLDAVGKWKEQDVGPTALNLQPEGAWHHFLNYMAYSGLPDLVSRSISAYACQEKYSEAGHPPASWVLANAKARDAEKAVYEAEKKARVEINVQTALISIFGKVLTWPQPDWARQLKEELNIALSGLRTTRATPTLNAQDRELLDAHIGALSEYCKREDLINTGMPLLLTQSTDNGAAVNAALQAQAGTIMERRVAEANHRIVNATSDLNPLRDTAAQLSNTAEAFRLQEPPPLTATVIGADGVTHQGAADALVNQRSIPRPIGSGPETMLEIVRPDGTFMPDESSVETVRYLNDVSDVGTPSPIAAPASPQAAQQVVMPESATRTEQKSLIGALWALCKSPVSSGWPFPGAAAETIPGSHGVMYVEPPTQGLEENRSDSVDSTALDDVLRVARRLPESVGQADPYFYYEKLENWQGDGFRAMLEAMEFSRNRYAIYLGTADGVRGVEIAISVEKVWTVICHKRDHPSYRTDARVERPTRREARVAVKEIVEKPIREMAEMAESGTPLKYRVSQSPFNVLREDKVAAPTPPLPKTFFSEFPGRSGAHKVGRIRSDGPLPDGKQLAVNIQYRPSATRRFHSSKTILVAPPRANRGDGQWPLFLCEHINANLTDIAAGELHAGKLTPTNAANNNDIYAPIGSDIAAVSVRFVKLQPDYEVFKSPDAWQSGRAIKEFWELPEQRMVELATNDGSLKVRFFSSATRVGFNIKWGDNRPTYYSREEFDKFWRDGQVMIKRIFASKEPPRYRILGHHEAEGALLEGPVQETSASTQELLDPQTTAESTTIDATETSSTVMPTTQAVSLQAGPFLHGQFAHRRFWETATAVQALGNIPGYFLLSLETDEGHLLGLMHEPDKTPGWTLTYQNGNATDPVRVETDNFVTLSSSLRSGISRIMSLPGSVKYVFAGNSGLLGGAVIGEQFTFVAPPANALTEPVDVSGGLDSWSEKYDGQALVKLLAPVLKSTEETAQNVTLKNTEVLYRLLGDNTAAVPDEQWGHSATSVSKERRELDKLLSQPRLLWLFKRALSIADFNGGEVLSKNAIWVMLRKIVSVDNEAKIKSAVAAKSIAIPWRLDQIDAVVPILATAIASDLTPEMMRVMALLGSIDETAYVGYVAYVAAPLLNMPIESMAALGLSRRDIEELLDLASPRPASSTTDSPSSGSLDSLFDKLGLDRLCKMGLCKVESNGKRTLQAPAPDVWQLMASSEQFSALTRGLLEKLGWYGANEGESASPTMARALGMKVLSAYLFPPEQRKPGHIFDLNLWAAPLLDLNNGEILEKVKTAILNKFPGATSAAVDLVADILCADIARSLLVPDVPSHINGRSLQGVNFLQGLAMLETIEPGSSRYASFSELAELPLAKVQGEAWQQLWVRTRMFPALRYMMAHNATVGQVAPLASASVLTAALEFLSNEDKSHAKDMADLVKTKKPDRKKIAEERLAKWGIDKGHWNKSMDDLDSLDSGLHDDLWKEMKEREESVVAGIPSLLDAVMMGWIYKKNEPTVLELFNQQFDKYAESRLQPLSRLVLRLLKELPEQHRRTLLDSACQVNQLSFDGEAGEYGIVLRCQERDATAYQFEHCGFRYVPGLGEAPECFNELNYEILPFAGVARPILQDITQIGQKRDIHNIPTSWSPPEPQLPFDSDAYLNSTVARFDDKIPNPRKAKFIPMEVVARKKAGADEAQHLESLANAVARGIFSKQRFDALKEEAKHVTHQEAVVGKEHAVARHVAELVPFVSCIENLSEGNNSGPVVAGCILDAVSVALPVGEFFGTTVKVVWRLGEMTLVSASEEMADAIFKIGTEFIRVSPAGIVEDIANGAVLVGRDVLQSVRELPVFKHLLARSSRNLADMGIENSGGLYHVIEKKAGAWKPLAQGDQLNSVNGVERTLVRNVGSDAQPHYLLLDPESRMPFGPRLMQTDDGRLVIYSKSVERTVPVKRATDGSYVVDAGNAKVQPIERSDSTVDVLIDGNPYNFDPQHPGALREISSVPPKAESKLKLGLCRTKRSPGDEGCPLTLATELGTATTEAEQSVQAFSARRFELAKVEMPGSSTAPGTTYDLLVHNRRIYKWDASSGKLLDATPQELQKMGMNLPLKYADRVNGHILNEPGFGLPVDGVDQQIRNRINQDTVVVQLDRLIPGLDSKHTQRGIIVDDGGGNRIVVVEAEPLIFYASSTSAPLQFRQLNGLPSSAQTPQAHVFGDELLIDKYIAQSRTYRVFDSSGQTLPLVNHPSTQELTQAIVGRLTGITAENLEETRAALNYSPDQWRGFLVKTLRELPASGTGGAVKNVEYVVPRIQLSGAPNAQANQEFAKAALAIVRKDFKATGLKAANKRHTPSIFPTAVEDTQRLSQTDPIVTRMYSNEASLQAGQYSLVLKLGAGNCDHTAGVAAQMINKSGGNAATWYVDGAHTFTVVGDVPVIVGKRIDSTIGFSEPGWDQVWIVDPWANIACPANQYLKKFEAKMQQWSKKGKQIYWTKEPLTIQVFSGVPPLVINRSGWWDAQDPDWLALMNNTPKRFGHRPT